MRLEEALSKFGTACILCEGMLVATRDGEKFYEVVDRENPLYSSLGQADRDYVAYPISWNMADFNPSIVNNLDWDSIKICQVLRNLNRTF